MAIVACHNCGKEFHVKPSRLKNRQVKHCSRECRTQESGGLTVKYPKEYSVFLTAKARCGEKGKYFERGIEFRFQSFAEFMECLGPRPSDLHSLDREDNDGHYEVGNVRWATLRQQQMNRRCTIRLTYRGQTKFLEEWAELFGLKYNTLYARIKLRKWPVQRALETPS